MDKERSRGRRLGASSVVAATVVATAAQSEILTRLRAYDDPVGVAELASAAKQHPNTVREHLEVLVAAGLATRERDTPTGRGRPAYLYAAHRDETAPAHVALLDALAEHLAVNTLKAGEVAIGLGRAYAAARFVGDEQPESSRRRAVQRLGVAMEGLGFATEPLSSGRALRLISCPLRESADRNSEVVCGFHLGMVQAAAVGAGLDPSEVRLLPFAEPGACRLELAQQVPGNAAPA